MAKRKSIARAVLSLPALIPLILFVPGCVVEPREGFVEPREGYYDHEHHHWWHEHGWRDCGDRDEHCRS
jgi:hypothetical protein